MVAGFHRKVDEGDALAAGHGFEIAVVAYDPDKVHVEIA